MKLVDKMETWEHRNVFHITRIIKTFNGVLHDAL